MTRMKLSSQDKNSLDKFMKFWAMKSTQVIVQSRLGEKASTISKPQSSSNVWFELNIVDLPDVLEEAKRVLGDDISLRLPVCIEISLRTTEGDHMVLETWCLGVTREFCDPSARIVHTVYNRLGILLKSLISITRAVPGYKLSRRQGPDTFVLCYRFYVGEAQVQLLGDGYKVLRIGQICTPIGTLDMSLSYRTKMTISPTHTGRDNAIMLKSDHFNTNHSPKSNRCSESEDKYPSLSVPMKIGAFAVRREMTEEDKKKLNLFVPPELPPKLLYRKKVTKRTEVKETTDDQPLNDSKTKSEIDENVTEQIKNCLPMNSLNARLGLPAPKDDFVFVGLKTPFAPIPTEKVELGKIYKEWKDAPRLQEFDELPPLETLEITKQLESFESNVTEYDSIVESFCQTSLDDN